MWHGPCTQLARDSLPHNVIKVGSARHRAVHTDRQVLLCLKREAYASPFNTTLPTNHLNLWPACGMATIPAKARSHWTRDQKPKPKPTKSPRNLTHRRPPSIRGVHGHIGHLRPTRAQGQAYCRATTVVVVGNVSRHGGQCQSTWWATSVDMVGNVSRHGGQCQSTWWAMSYDMVGNVHEPKGQCS